MNDICNVCGCRHGADYLEDARRLVNAIRNAEPSSGAVNFMLEGGAVNSIGAKILLKHALKFLDETSAVKLFEELV